MSQPHLNDLSKIYLDQIANVRKAEAEADVKRWEEIGGPTPTNYKPTGDSAKIRATEEKCNWREEFINEYGDPSAVAGPAFKTEKDAEKKVKEVKGIKNKVEINPKLHEVVKELGGELIEATEIDFDIESAVEYFYEEGINEEGIDLIIEEIGLEEFVEFVTDDSPQFLNEERKARKMNVRTLKATKKKAEEIKADKSDVVSRITPRDIISRARGERSLKKPRLAKPAPKKKAETPKKPAAPKKPVAPKKPAAPKKPVAKKVVKAVAKVKPTQPKKEVSKSGLRDRIRTAVKAGVKRHKKAVQPARVFAKGFKRGVTDTVKFAGKAKKAVVGEEALAEKKKPSVHDDYYDPMEDPTFDPHEAEATRGQSGRGTKGKMNVRKKYPVKEATDAQLKAQEKAVFELEKREANADRAKAKKAREKEINEVKVTRLEDKQKKAAREAMLQALEQQAIKKKKALAKEENEIDEDVKSSEATLARKQLVLDRQKLQLRRRSHALAKKEKETDAGTNADAQANVIAQEAKIDTGTAAEKATARNKRNTPPGKDYKFDTSVFITRKPGESLDSARTRTRQKAHAAKRGLKEDKAFDNVVAALRKKHGKDAVLTKDSPKPKAQPRPKAKPDTRTPEQKKKDQDHANVMARYGGEANYKAGRGLGT